MTSTPDLFLRMALSRRRLLGGLAAGTVGGLVLTDGLLTGLGKAWAGETMPSSSAGGASGGVSSHALAMHGSPKYGADFTHFAYANPDAPKGGEVKLAAIGTYDSFNPFIFKGAAPDNIGLLFDTLLTSSADEAFTEYGLLAEHIEMPEDRSWVAFTLRKEARFHDGTPVTVDDVIWSLETLKEKGAPFYGFYYANVKTVEKTGPHTVRFVFDGSVNRELPLILGQLPILPRHVWEGRDFAKPGLDIPIGSGPYKIRTFEAGRFITYERDPDWWGKDLPVVRGFYNFDTVHIDYYRDGSVALEAFKAHAYDFRVENMSKAWATAYDFPAVKDHKVMKVAFPNHMPSGMQGFAFNLRRPLFADRRVRQALGYAYDFEWANQNLFYGQYERTESYFDNSELAATGLPGKEELALLEPLKKDLPPEVFTKVYKAPVSDGEGGARKNLRTAMHLLKEAGWSVRNGVLVNAQGQPFAFEILLVSPAFERVVLPYIQSLKRLGIQASVRTVDSAQYQTRVDSYDFDMIVASWGQSLSPGNEQREFWGCDAAHRPGSRNLTGICSPAIDALITHVITAGDRDELVTATRALDRALLWSYLVVPHWHASSDRVAFWNQFGIPDVVPSRGVSLFTWWSDPKGVPPDFQPKLEG